MGQMPVTKSGAQSPEISCHAHLSHAGDFVIALVAATLLAFCILCSVSDYAYANAQAIQQTQQTRALSAVASIKKGDLRTRSEWSSRSGFGPVFDAPASLPVKLNRSVGRTIVGAASWYNPYVESDDTETASGERYDPDEWTAAIQIELRAQFGGVAFGKDYRAAYALVESGDKRVIVKINDVGPLEPGRVIDLSERAMRYFDETLLFGLLPSVKLTPLRGDSWVPGPLGSDLSKTEWCGPETPDATA